jgi:sterol 3beta-glucosyltransferase
VRLLAVTYGTDGDTRPVVALCRALMDAGHEIGLLSSRSGIASADALGVPARALAGDILGALQSSERRGGAFLSTSGSAAQLAIANTDAWMRDVLVDGRGCDAIVVSGLAAHVGLAVAEHLGVTCIGAALIPLTPTRAFPSPFLPPGTVPPSLNFASHKFVNESLWHVPFREALDAARASVCGLPPRKADSKGHPILYGVSHNLVTQPADWPAHVHLCGQWVPRAESWSAPQALQEFLAAGERPVYVGFGSMAGDFDWRALLTAVIDAVDHRRAVFHPGWSGVHTGELPANFFVVGETPHSWLFPRMAVIIHHGGSGTTHSAARAGVPSVVVPFAEDQFFWADRLRRLGVAPEPVAVDRVRAADLAQGIAFAASSSARARAVALRDAMASENGLAKAVSIVEALLSERRRSK